MTTGVPENLIVCHADYDALGPAYLLDGLSVKEFGRPCSARVMRLRSAFADLMLYVCCETWSALGIPVGQDVLRGTGECCGRQWARCYRTG